jgi:hypothetical protein
LHIVSSWPFSLTLLDEAAGSTIQFVLSDNAGVVGAWLAVKG